MFRILLLLEPLYLYCVTSLYVSVVLVRILISPLEWFCGNLWKVKGWGIGLVPFSLNPAERREYEALR